MQRRVFLKSTAALLAAAGLPACLPDDGEGEPTPEPTPGGGDAIDGDPSDDHYAWDRNGNRYEFLPDEHLLRRLDADGNTVWELGGHIEGEEGVEGVLLNRPERFESTEDGFLYIVDRGNHRIVVVNPDGEITHFIGEPEGEDDGLHHPADVAVDADGNLHVLDSHNHRMLVYDHDGTLIDEFGEFGTDEAHHVNKPGGIAIDSRGHVHVVDKGNGRVQVYDANGAWLRQYGEPGEGDGQFHAPRDIVIGPGDVSYVADAVRGVVQSFDATGAPLERQAVTIDGVLAHPLHLELTPQGGLHVRVADHRAEA